MCFWCNYRKVPWVCYSIKRSRSRFQKYQSYSRKSFPKEQKSIPINAWHGKLPSNVHFEPFRKNNSIYAFA